MNIPQTFSLLLFIRKLRSNARGEAAIYLRITVDGKTAEISTKCYVNPQHWNPQKGRVKGNGEKARILNQSIDHLELLARQKYNELKDQGQPVTALSIKNRMLGVEEKKHSLMSVFAYHNAQMKAQVGKEFAAGTLQRYEITFRLVREFMEQRYQCSDIYLSDLKYEFITELEYYFKTVRSCSHNTTTKYLTNVRKIVNIALKNDWLANDPFKRMRFSLKEVKRDYLTSEELQVIINKPFPTARLALVRDLFVFSCYTGLAYSDIKKLSLNEISRGLDGEYWLFTERLKTGSSSHVPLLPIAIQLIEQYRSHPAANNQNKVFPVLSNQKMNAYLKEIGDVCGIHKNITFHIARHTFATTITLSNGIPMETVSSMLGHKNLRTTQIYAKVIQQKVSKDMKMLKEKLEHDSDSSWTTKQSITG
jgi:site-specific recombinase XerD